MLTYNEITENEAIKTYIIRADESLDALGFTEHSFAHVTHVAETAGYILKTLGHDDRTIELAKIAGKVNRQGYTLVPLKLYFKDALVKMEIALCKGKHTYDKKQSIAERDVKRSIDRDIKNAGF